MDKKQLPSPLRLADKRLGYLINFGAELIKDGTSRIANGVEDWGTRQSGARKGGAAKEESMTQHLRALAPSRERSPTSLSTFFGNHRSLTAAEWRSCVLFFSSDGIGSHAKARSREEESEPPFAPVPLVSRSPTSLPTFFDNLDSFAETPEGVAKLRALVLDLAVRGKLVEQDENDEPASELVSRATSAPSTNEWQECL